MRRKKEEIVPADPALRKNLLIVASIYILFLVWLEPLIDFLLMQMPMAQSHEAILVLNQKKAYVATIAFGVARSLPIMFFVWFALMIVHAQRLPPKGMRMPVAIRVMEGPKAKVLGMMAVVMGLLLLFRELSIMMAIQPVVQ